MFSIRFLQQQGFEQVVLQDEGNGSYAAIVPAWGGLLHAFAVSNRGQTVNVIEGYSDAIDFAENVAAKGFRSCKLSPFVCRLKNGSYRFGQEGYKVEKFYLGQHALHGLLYNAAFTVAHSHADENGATLNLLHRYRGEDAGYPFFYDCQITYTLEPNSRLSLCTTIVNQGPGLMPVQDGWHPYFGFGGSIDHLQLEFQAKEMVMFDDELLPTGQLERYETFGSLAPIGSAQFDHCFTLNFAECQPLCVLRDAAQKLQLEIYPDRSYPYLQIYTPPHRQSIAIENLSGAPDAFNNGMGLTTLAAGERASFETAYQIKLL
jgi:aldose 1-epimerase